MRCWPSWSNCQRAKLSQCCNSTERSWSPHLEEVSTACGSGCKEDVSRKGAKTQTANAFLKFSLRLGGFARETFSCHRSANVTLGFFFCKASNLINQTTMNDLGQRIARLSPEKRALLVQRLAPL